VIRWLLCLIGAAALAQQPPVPPLRPILMAPNTTMRTNANGDLVVTMIIPREVRSYYYGIRSTEFTQPHLVMLGHWTKAEYEAWAFAGGQTLGTGGGPQVQHWAAVFSTTNQIEPTLIHARSCP